MNEPDCPTFYKRSLECSLAKMGRGKRAVKGGAKRTHTYNRKEWQKEDPSREVLKRIDRRKKREGRRLSRDQVRAW